MSKTYDIVSIQTGKSAPLRNSPQKSAIAKTPRSGPVRVSFLGLEGDEQADKVHHGGPEMALHLYPADHYPFWREELADHPLLAEYGAFGENISSLGLTEDVACIGDRYRLGSALVEISMGRQPCWKLERHFEYSKIPKVVVKQGIPGWYFRVIEEGEVAAGDTLDLLDRPEPQWSVARTFGLLFGGGHRTAAEALEPLSGLELLAPQWRARAAELAAA